MARRKRGDEPDGSGVAVADPPPNGVHTGPPPAPAPADGPADEPPAEPKKRPASSFAAMTDRTTRLEIAVWSREVKVGEAESYTQYSLTLTRSWKDREGVWSSNAFLRVHDLPVLLYLVEQAYHWCLARRTQVRVETTGDVPF